MHLLCCIRSIVSIHSVVSILLSPDIAFEEQEEALAPAGPDEVKVVIATNAAESSITLPDVDDVICFGAKRTSMSSYLLSYDTTLPRTFPPTLNSSNLNITLP